MVPSTPQEEARIPVKNCNIALLQAWVRVEKFPSGIEEIKEKQEPYTHWYSVPNRLHVHFVAAVKYATLSFLEMIPPINWLPCTVDHGGYLYIMHVAAKNDDGLHRSCYRIMGSQEPVDLNGNFKIEFASIEYSMITRYDVKNCAKAYNYASIAISSIIFMDKLWIRTTVQGKKCYSMQENSFPKFKRAIGHAISD